MDAQQTKLMLGPAIQARSVRARAGTQARLSQFGFEPAQRIATIRSVRMAKAVQRLAGSTHSSRARGACSSPSDAPATSNGSNRRESDATNVLPIDAAAVELQLDAANKPERSADRGSKKRKREARRRQAAAKADAERGQARENHLRLQLRIQGTWPQAMELANSLFSSPAEKTENKELFGGIHSLPLSTREEQLAPGRRHGLEDAIELSASNNAHPQVTTASNIFD
jgi:hypothetical protein